MIGRHLTKRVCPCPECLGHEGECTNFQNVHQSLLCSICYVQVMQRLDTTIAFPLTTTETHEKMNIEGGTKT